LQLLGSGLVPETRTPVEEAERLMAVLDGLSVRMVLQPSWATAEQGRDTLRRHLASLLEP